MSSLTTTINSHEFQSSGEDAQFAPSSRPRELTRRFRETFGGWPQMWAIWQDVPMTPWGYPMSAAPFARGATGTPTDRLGGRDIPLVWTEVDLRGFRVLSKFLCDTNPFAAGILRMLQDYHIRKGYGWQVCRAGAKKTAYPTADTDDDLVRRGQMIIDAWRRKVKWGKLSREAFKHYCREGEVFALFGGSGWGKLPWVRFVHSDQVGNPSGSTTTPQSFGIETAPHDIMDRWAYHIWDEVDYPSGGEWIEAERIVHAKKNVDLVVKRGLPDFFPIQDNLDTVRKLLTNMIGTAAAQAAIAWREKYPTATMQQIQSMVPIRGADENCLPGAALPEWWRRRNSVDPGTILKTEGNREFEEAMSSPVANFIEAEQACLRAAAVRVGFPESIVTGKIDDVNFAASLTTNAPMAVRVEGAQFEWGEDFETECALKVLDYAAEAGLISRTERLQLDVEVTEPTIITPEPDKESERRATMFDRRILSGPTWQLMEQLSPQHEAENWKHWDLMNPPPVSVDGEGKDGAVATKTAKAKEAWNPSDHPRGQPENAGEFGPGGGKKAAKTGKKASAKPASDDRTEKMAQQAKGIVKKIATAKNRASDSPPSTQIDSRLAGAIGEEILIQHLKSLGYKDAGQTSDFMKSTRNNLPFDMIHDHQLIEAKAGQAANTGGVWALKYDGRFTKDQEAKFAKLPPDKVAAAKKKINKAKVKAIHDRKDAFVNEMHDKLGFEIRPGMMTVIINHETKTADIYKFDGIFDRIAFQSDQAKAGYVRSVKYG